MRRAALAIMCALLAVACGRSRNTDSGPTVVAAFYPLYEAASRVAGDAATVANLTPPGVEPHDLELTSDALDMLIDADVVVYVGRGFQPALEAALKDAEGETIDALEGIRPAGGDSGDPHVWLDPQLLAQIVGTIERALAQALPDHASALEERADAYRAELAALDAELESGLRTCRRRLLVTSHAAFGYLTSRYGLEQRSVAGVSPEAEPDPKRLADLTDLVRAQGVTTIFTESLVSPKVAETLAREAGVKTAVLDPIEGLSKDDIAAGRTYSSIMRDNLRTLREALDCR